MVSVRKNKLCFTMFLSANFLVYFQENYSKSFIFSVPSYNIKMAQHLLSGNYVVATVCVAGCFPDAF